ncbi:hypothetical protein [Dongia mobilis]|uniref:hypothetical protein n=1 Tax=Dongia sp. TaxID=1977262 RepID=UPI0026F0EEF6
MDELQAPAMDELAAEREFRGQVNVRIVVDDENQPWARARRTAVERVVGFRSLIGLN